MIRLKPYFWLASWRLLEIVTLHSRTYLWLGTAAMISAFHSETSFHPSFPHYSVPFRKDCTEQTDGALFLCNPPVPPTQPGQLWRNANQLEAALPHLIKTKLDHRGCESGGPTQWNVSKTSDVHYQRCFIWFGVCSPFMLNRSLEKWHKRLPVCFHGCLHTK